MTEAAKPTLMQETLTTWEKIQAGVRGFAKKFFDYLPRGALFIGMMFAGSALVESVTGLPILNVLSPQMTPPLLATRMVGALLLGGMVSGAIGSWEETIVASNQRKAECEFHRAKQQHCECAPQPQQAMEPSVGVQAGLPAHTHAASKHAACGING